MYEVPTNTESQRRVYCTQSYSILQKTIFVTRTRHFQITQQKLPLHQDSPSNKKNDNSK